MLTPRLFISTLLVLAVTQSSVAEAEDPESLIRSGVQLRREGKDQEALEKFQQAYALSQTPRALAQVGMAEHAVGLWTDAEKHVGEALLATDDPWITKNRSALVAELAVIQNHIGQIEILGGPPGAEVRIEGQVAGTLPMTNPMRIAAGTAAVEVRAPGYLPATRVVTVVAGELSRERIILQKLARPMPSTETGGGEPVATDHPTDVGLPSSGSWHRRLAWITAGTAGLFIASGTVGLIVRESKAQWFTDRAHGCDFNAQDKGGPGCKEAFDSGQTAKSLGVISFIAAGVVAAGSMALFLTTPRSREGQGSVAGIACTPNLAGITCAARF